MGLAQKFIARLLWNWGAPLVQATISIAMLPIITAILGPAEIGTFALVMSLSALVSAVSGMGSTYILSAHYPTAPSAVRQELVSTIAALSAAIAVMTGVAAVALWSLLAERWPAVAGIPLSSVHLAMAAAIASVPWTIATDILTLCGRARAFAIISIIQSLIGATVTVLCLYVFGLELTALFVSTLAVSGFGGLAGLILLRRDLRFRVDRRWLKECIKVGPIMGGAHLLEMFHTVVERALLARIVGLTALGIYAHSQQYRNMVQIGVKGLARSVWPVSLDEARPPRRDFELTNRAWRAMTVAVTAIGVLAAFFGQDAVAALTHGKFAEAGPYIALWMVYVLVQNTGKPQLAVLFAERRGIVLGWIGQGARALGIVLLFLLVPAFGLAGAFAALLFQQFALRVMVHLHARRAGTTPFQDGWVLAGCGMILLALLLNQSSADSLPARSALAVGCLLMVFAGSQAVLRDAVAFVRR